MSGPLWSFAFCTENLLGLDVQIEARSHRVYVRAWIFAPSREISYEESQLYNTPLNAQEIDILPGQLFLNPFLKPQPRHFQNAFHSCYDISCRDHIGEWILILGSP
jgi:hypothetical protein